MSASIRLKEVRSSLGLTQAEFGKRLNVTWYKIKDLELNRLKLTDDFAIKINKEFGINYKWILYGEAPRESIWSEGITIASVVSGPLLDIYDVGLESKISQALTSKKSIDNINSTPLTTEITIDVTFHDPNIIASVLDRAKGHCELCQAKAPFLKKSDGTPYLEIHHNKSLCDGGSTSVENIIALCPNCHRKIHFG